MKMNLSVLIICKDISKLQSVLSEVLSLDHQNIDWEVLVGEGDNPSEQRNVLALKANGDWLLFLDDDSRPIKNLLIQYKNLVESRPVLLAGGPSLIENDSSLIGELSQFFFSSLWGIGPYLSRYNSIGELRQSNERELILCNMLVQKDFFIKQGGFCRDLYPNEENEFIKRIQADSQIYYIPTATVERPARKSISEFSLQLFNYGKGRFKNIYLKKNFSDFIFVAPAFFSFYLLAAPFLFYFLQWALLIPLFVYTSIILISGLKSFNKLKSGTWLSPFFFALGHFSYGLGIWNGFFEFVIFQKNLKASPASFINVHQLK
jgi:glycosyltransferase involved in cell wall biosynthesis